MRDPGDDRDSHAETNSMTTDTHAVHGVAHEQVTLDRTLRLIDEVRFTVPRFRSSAFTWTEEQVHRFLESISLGYPTGEIIIWEPFDKTARADAWKLPVQESSGEFIGTNRLVVDGVQRLTTIGRALNGYPPNEPVRNGVDWRIHIDAGTGRIGSGPDEPRRTARMPMTALRSTVRFMSWYQELMTDESISRDTRSDLASRAEALTAVFRDHILVMTTVSEATAETMTEIRARASSTPTA